VKAFRLLEAEQLPMLVDVPKPKAGSGQVVNKVGGAGLCHTDLALIRRKKALHARFFKESGRLKRLSDVGDQLEAFEDCGGIRGVRVQPKDFSQHHIASLVRKYGGTPFSAPALAEIPDVDAATSAS
jgi:hypothetical protein